MRILYALDSYRPNIDGVGVSIERQAKGLAALGHDVALIVPAPSFAEYEEHSGDLRVMRVRTAQLIRAQWRLAIVPSELIESAFADFQPDVVVVSLPFPLGWRVLRRARRLGVPVVGITGTMPEWLIYSMGWLRPVIAGFYHRIWEVLVAFYNRCDFVVGVTNTALRYLQKHGLERPTCVISNGVDLRVFGPRPRHQELGRALGLPDKPTVLYTGRLDAEKRVDVLVRAIAVLGAQCKAHFVIGGDGSERVRLQSEVVKLGLAERVSFIGFLPGDDYPLVYSLADVFAIASPAELQSIVCLEAAASGLPIVAADAGALPELVQHGRNGYLFADGSSSEAAARLAVLLGDPERARWMGMQSSSIAKQHDIRHSIAQYDRLYNGLILAHAATA